MRVPFAALALVCAVMPCSAAEPAGETSDASWTSSFAEDTLVAVDDSKVTLSPMEGRIVLDYVSHAGATQKTTFSFVSDRMGTVADDDSNGKAIGFFRQTDVGLEITYEDGRTASLFANVAEGLTMTRRGAGGETVCVSWYPKDHVFSAAEKRAAVDAYAQSLGINEKPAAPPPPSRKSRAHKTAAVAAAKVSACSPPMTRAAKAQVVAVRKSDVHAVDPAPAVAATAAPATVAGGAPPPPPPETVASGTGASQCLSVEVQGTYVGFRNRCANDVQLVYCLEKASDAAISCGTGAKPAAVSALGFTGVLADSAAAEHDVRWVGCSGAPGEVAAQLDRADPPAGHCVRKGS